MTTEDRFDDERSAFVSGLFLRCHDCGSEIEVILPTPRDHPDPVFRCCGKDLVPTTPAES